MIVLHSFQINMEQEPYISLHKGYRCGYRVRYEALPIGA